MIGKDLENLQDKEGNYFFQGFCQAAKNPQGGWTAYFWPKPGEPEEEVFRKISFTIQVPNRPYQVSAGIYNDSITVEELNETLR
ncbi:MAG: cache domain-containing protein [Desulfohalobiaceae bacterium]|nr:cache domain-containing protein [Desulfohalobiaceae bacterium]